MLHDLKGVFVDKLLHNNDVSLGFLLSWAVFIYLVPVTKVFVIFAQNSQKFLRN